MTKTLPIFLMLLAAALFGACGDHDHSDGDGHDDHGHAHDGDDHGHDDHDHGDRVEVGTAKAGEYSVTLALFGEIEAGHEAVLDVEVEGGSVSAVRAWVGVSSGRGSLKAKIDFKDGEYHGHVEVPQKLTDGSEIWVEIEDAEGKKAQASFKIPK